MKVSLKWIAEMVEVPPLEQLVQKLTFSGLEVEAIERPGEALRGVVVAEIVASAPHPNADRLSVTQVSIGSGAPRTVVCGAKNFKVGDRVPWATPGTTLPDGKKIEAAALRGVDSAGMLCSAVELGLAEKAEGLLLLPKDAPLGAPIATALGIDDTFLTLNVTPNRPDALSHIGVAREIAALTGRRLKADEPVVVESELDAGRAIEVKLEDPKACPRFCGRVLDNVKVGPSPDWMQARLKACGIRPINNVVDVTNWVLLELGQPMHAYDLDKLKGGKLVARRARQGEKLKTLDGKERTCTPEDVIIADSEAAQGLAGVMGGGLSEVTESTTRVLLESAYFDPATVRRAAKRHQLHTEASHRFERGCNPFGMPKALDRAVALLESMGAGKARKGRIDVMSQLPEGKVVGLRYARIQEVLGVDVPREEVFRILDALGFPLDLRGPEQALFTVPGFRVDVSREEDLIEEVARIWGYQKIPDVLPRGVGSLAPEAQAPSAERLMRSALAGAGFSEVVNYSFVSPRELEILAPGTQAIRIGNPLSVEQSVMRTTLLPGLLQNVSRAVRFNETTVRLYELGRAYLPDAQGGVDHRPVAIEPLRLGGALYGKRDGRAWNAVDAAVDFFDAKGAVEAVLAALRLSDARFEPGAPAVYHPRAAAKLSLPDGKVLGHLGELHPEVSKALDLPRGIFVFELDVATLVGASSLLPRFQALPRHPALLRDLAVVVSVDVPQERVRDAIQEAGGAWVESAVVFDQYSGSQLPEGKKNLAFAIRYRDAERTLTDVEVSAAHERIVKAVQERFGASLRGV